MIYKRVLTGCLLAACFLPLTGCNLVAGIYGVFIDPLIPAPLVRAEHEMGDKNVLIWIDDLAAADSHPTLRRRLTEELADALLSHKAVAYAVPYEDIARFRVMRTEYRQMSIQDLGGEFQADQVIYLQVDHFEFVHEAGKGYYQPAIKGHAKIIDCHDEGERVWPERQAQYPFGVEGEFEEGRGDSFEERLIRKLGEKFAQEFAIHFYDHRKKK
jgi:hypothetical protein